MAKNAYLVETSGAVGQPFFGGPFQGPIKYNNCDYVVIESDNGLNVTIGVFKSDPNVVIGAPENFVQQDSAHAPASDHSAVYWPTDSNGSIIGTKIYCATRIGSGALGLIAFDLSTNTWGTPITGGPTPISSSTFCLSVFGSTWTILYSKISGTVNAYCQQYNGGWGSETIVAVNVDGVAQIGTNPAIGDMLLVVKYGSLTGIKVFGFSGGVLSSGVTYSPLKYFTNATSGVIYIPSTDQFVFPIVNAQNTDVSNEIDVLVAHPSVNPTTLTLQLVQVDDPSGSGTDYDNGKVVLSPDGLTLYCFYVFNSGTFQQLLYKSRPVASSIWSSASVAFDTAVDSLIPPPDAAFLPYVVERPAVSIYGDGVFAVTFGTFAQGNLTPPDGYCDVQYFFKFELSPPIPTLTIACPIGGGSATVGVPYASGEPVVTGDPTLPLSWSLAGGSLPPGMTLNPDTGEVSGTTYVAGTYSYTLKATDSSSPPLMATVDEPCSIPVGGGSGTLPCDNITPQPSTDVRFKLIKVVATMRPEVHMPVRGSTR